MNNGSPCSLNGFAANARIAFSVALLLSCVYTYAYSQLVTCVLANCTSPTSTVITAMFPQAVAAACMLSRIAVMYNEYTLAIRAYERKIEKYNAHFPLGAGKANCRRAFASAVVAVSAAATLPANTYRHYLLRHRFPDDYSITVYFSLMDLQNVSMCVTEIHFVVYCFGLYQRFQSINEEMAAVKAATIAANRYPSVLKSERGGVGSPASPVRDRDECCSARIDLCPLFDVIEQFKARHQFVRDAVRGLNELYGVQLGLALCVLFIMALFDVYEVMSSELYTEQSNLFVYGWLAQYAFRFCAIVMTTHVTTKQAIVAGTTYLVILLQFRKS